MSANSIPANDDAEGLADALREMHLLADGEDFTADRFGGGVSCDAWLVIKEDGTQLVVKRALPQLRVKAEWRAPAERSQAEASWFRLVSRLDPALAPQVLGEAPARHMLAISYFSPEQYRLWKTQLAAGNADPGFAASVGAALARIHAATANSERIAAQFANQAQFFALRLEPYLLYTADRHPDVAPRIRAMASAIGEARISLMHGDVSPKNILHGPQGPVFLDAETACYGDPAFDLAFCLNHLMLKSVWHPEFADGYRAAFAALAHAYLRGLEWEDAAALERRAAALLPALLLARIDGKSPVEYIASDSDKQFVRGFAKTMLAGKVEELAELSARWHRALRAR